MEITCASCGKAYDYGKDELCPRCGAYNRPGAGLAPRRMPPSQRQKRPYRGPNESSPWQPLLDRAKVWGALLLVGAAACGVIKLLDLLGV